RPGDRTSPGSSSPDVDPRRGTGAVRRVAYVRPSPDAVGPRAGAGPGPGPPGLAAPPAPASPGRLGIVAAGPAGRPRFGRGPRGVDEPGVGGRPARRRARRPPLSLPRRPRPPRALGPADPGSRPRRPRPGGRPLRQSGGRRRG